MAIDRAGATTSRLTIDDWVQAGFAILAEEGIKALKIDRLCSRLAVTKGSFYWHFTDIAGYRATLIEAWGELRDDDRRHFGEMAPIPPRERLSQMMSALLSTRHWTLERAMRVGPNRRRRRRQCPSSRPTDSRCRPPSVSGLRVRCRGRGFARQRDVRRRNRVSASVRRDAERPRGGSSERFLDLMLAR